MNPERQAKNNKETATVIFNGRRFLLIARNTQAAPKYPNA
jgi:hypothetical protein